MGWFENQIEERRAADQQLLEDSFAKVAGVVLGWRAAQRIRDERIVTKDAIDEILKYFHRKAAELPENLASAEEQLDYSMRPHGIMRREVELTDGWYKDAFGPMLAYTEEDGFPVALLPGRVGGYYFKDPKTGHRQAVTKKTAAQFQREAVCFYRPLPARSLKLADLLRFMKSSISMRDVALITIATFAATLIGLVTPRIVQALTGPILASEKQSALLGVALTMLGVAITTQLIRIVKELILARLSQKVSIDVESAMMMRLLSLPASFFRKYSPGELRSRSASVGRLSSSILDLIFTGGLTSLSSLLYVTQIFRFAPALVVPSIIIVLVTIGFTIASAVAQIRLNRRHMEHAAKEAGMTFGLITGVQKLKLAGAETRSFAKWTSLYSEGAEMIYNPPAIIKFGDVISLAISLAGTIVLYFLAVKSGVDPSNYFAFTAAYGMLMGAFMSVSGIALSVGQIRPILEMAEPFLKTVPETSSEEEIVTELAGRVEVDHVSFRYDEKAPFVLDDLSLTFRPGEYVAIVGKTGCGKSTLVRLLLGFEKPEKGAVYYDGKDINSLDLPSLRKKIGTVMQDAGLFQGDIYSNIVITAPELTLDDA